jgi:hypothetical protein
VRAALNPNYQDEESSWLSAKGQAVIEVMGMATSVTPPPMIELNQRVYLPTVRR